MTGIKRIFSCRLATLLVLLSFTGAAAHAQFTSSPATVAITATLGETLTITATPTASITLSPGATSTPSSNITIVSTWNLGINRANVYLVGWFPTTTALTDGNTPANTIPTSNVLGQLTPASGTGGGYSAFTGSAPTGTGVGVTGASLTLYTQALSAATRVGGRTDTLNLEVNLASQTTLPAGTYTGTLNLEAVAL
ncbi:hypothetical protein [Silvibacterium acidisoli]|uniref:hypothetical protein n=1 Tax=Acidobacteriaceae bacterium ZG23-2 TaxID=2883246 RepID=UPI00406C391F